MADVRNERRELVKSTVDKRYQNNDCKMYSTHEELLARTDIDGVLIATGDRWHTPMSILAAKAGKHIYCEKPCSMTIEESQALAEGIRRYGVVYQAGCQRRNGKNFVFAMNLARDGKLGKLQTLHCNAGTGTQWPPITSHDWLPAEPEPAKEVIDWDRWLGPCPWRPYNPAYVAGRWRGFFDFHGGGILEWGSHTADLCQYVNNADDTQPVEYEPKGENTTPYFIYCRYANGVKLVHRDSGWMGLGTCSVRFEGDSGWVETGDSGKIEVSDNLKSELPPPEQGNAFNLTLHYHWRDFVECIKTRSLPKSHATAAANTHIGCHAAYIAYLLKRQADLGPGEAGVRERRGGQPHAVARDACAVAAGIGKRAKERRPESCKAIDRRLPPSGSVRQPRRRARGAPRCRPSLRSFRLRRSWRSTRRNWWRF